MTLQTLLKRVMPPQPWNVENIACRVSLKKTALTTSIYRAWTRRGYASLNELVTIIAKLTIMVLQDQMVGAGVVPCFKRSAVRNLLRCTTNIAVGDCGTPSIVKTKSIS